MNYDVWGPWTNTAGPNAPLDDSCVKDPNNQIGSATQAIASWAGAGFPIDQMVLGVASYGHGYNVNPDDAYTHVVRNGKTQLTTALNNSYPLFDTANIPAGDLWDGGPFVDQCGNQEGQG